MRFAHALVYVLLPVALCLPVACTVAAAPLVPVPTSVAASHAGAAYPVRVVPTECPLHIPEELEEGESILCGRLRVPQDRNKPAGLQIEFPFARVRAESAHPQPDPLVYVVGGPGGSALADFTEVYGWFRTLRRDRDLVIYDQRGTLFAQPVLDCNTVATPEVNAPDLAAAVAQVPAAYGPPDATDLGIYRCGEHLHSLGIDLAHYDTPTHAQDLVDLVHALGYAEYNLYATSYGTRIALEVLRQQAQDGRASGLRAMVLDAVVPPPVDTYEQQIAGARHEVVDHVLAQCAADPACTAAYPNLAARFEQLVHRLNAAPLALDLAWQPVFAGVDLLEFLYHRLDAGCLPYVPRLVAELEQGEVTTLVELLSGTLPPASSHPPAQPALWAAPDTSTAAGAVDEETVLDFVMRLNAAYYLNLEQLPAAARVEWQYMTARNPDRERLRRFMLDYLPPALAPDLAARLDEFGEAEVGAVFADLAGAPVHSLTIGANLAVECRDEVPFNSYAAAISSHRGAGLPDGRVAGEIEQMRHLWAQCVLFPTGAAAAIQTQPVTSAVPVVIFQGGLDIVTPPSWAAQAQRTLSRATYLEFPGQAHVVIRQPQSVASGCPAQITRQFLDAPHHPPDATCIDEHYRIEWLLP